MSKKTHKRIKSVATNVAIAFFFSAIFVLCYYYFLEGKISPYINLINTTAIKESSEVEETSSYSFETNRLINYPKYGKKYATLKIDSIKLSLPVYHGDTLKILKHGVGHYAGSYFPGENGSIILAAHNTKGFFDKLDKVKKEIK